MKFRFILILLFCFLVSPLYAASFDCNKATTETEKAICADPELSALDELMFFGYKQALRSNDWKRSEEEKDDGDLINSQRSAIETQIKCGADIKCLGDFYELRISELLLLAGFDSPGFTGDIVKSLLRFKEKFSEDLDLRYFASSKDGKLLVLLVSEVSAANIFEGMVGIVNYNEVTGFVLDLKNSKKGVQKFYRPGGTSGEIEISVTSGKIEIMEYFLRGWLSQQFRIVENKWFLELEESRGVTRPALGASFYTKTNYLDQIRYSSFGFTFMDCDIIAQPELIGDPNYDAVDKIKKYEYDWYLEKYNENELIEYFNELSDRELHLISVDAFSNGYFEFAIIGFNSLVDRNYNESRKDLECVRETFSEFKKNN